jgi:dTMP kinase
VLKNRDKPLFIVIDGIDGCGKSTIGRLTFQYLQGLSINVVLTREPGGSPFFEPIRRMLLKSESSIETLTETLLFFADRYEHIKKIIEPSLHANINVICDRFIASTYAYQCFGSGADINLVNTLKEHIVSFEPDITIILDIDIHLALKRINNKISDKTAHIDETRYEKLGISFYTKVRKGFLWYAKQFKNVFVVNANRDVDTVFADVINILEKY